MCQCSSLVLNYNHYSCKKQSGIEYYDIISFSLQVKTLVLKSLQLDKAKPFSLSKCYFTLKVSST